jgi:AcrR family transcriptional regulator
MNKKERLATFNRNNILNAAKHLFVEKGIDQTTMDDISKEAEYSKSTVYVYFKNKDEIFNYIILEYFGILKAAISDALRSEPEFPDGYFAVCKALSESYMSCPLFFESLMSEIKIPNDISETLLQEIYNVGEEINEIIESYLKKCVSTNQVNLDIPPIRATFILWAGITGIITTAHKKEAYINKTMTITKEDFMQDGFRLLLKAITEDKFEK